jgi:hypothetical protein
MSEVEKLYYGTKDIAAILGWNERRTRRWLHRTKAGFHLGKNLVTTPEVLKKAFPDVWLKICEDREERLLREADEADDDEV